MTNDEIKINDTANRLNQAIADGRLPDPGPPKRQRKPTTWQVCQNCGRNCNYKAGNGPVDGPHLCYPCRKKIDRGGTPWPDWKPPPPPLPPIPDLEVSPQPCSPQSSPNATEKPAPRCPNCGRPMRKTETGFRCDPCTDSTPEPAECEGCEFKNDRNVCTQQDDGRCPITMPKDATPRGPLTVAQETRGRDCGELAAKLIAKGCPDCGEKSISWNEQTGTPRISIQWECNSCGGHGVYRLPREGCYQVGVIGDAIQVRLGGCRMLYRISRLEAVAVWAKADHDVLTFRVGHETQTFAVDSAEEAYAAIEQGWSKP